MLEPSAIIEALQSQSDTSLNTCSDPNLNDNLNKDDKPKTLITAGPTWEALDSGQRA